MASPQISVAATAGPLDLGFQISIEGGEPGAVLRSVAIDGAQGTVEIGGTSYPTLTYQRREWPELSRVLYETLAVGTDRWFLIWFYCHDGLLDGVWWHCTRCPRLEWDTLVGTCTDLAGGWSGNPTFPPSTLALPALLSGVSFSGGDELLGHAISYDGLGPGEARLFGSPMVLLPFLLADCTDCRDGSGAGGWYEIHALFQSTTTGRTEFGIVYLRPSEPTVLRLNMGLALPNLATPYAPEMPGSWSITSP